MQELEKILEKIEQRIEKERKIITGHHHDEMANDIAETFAEAFIEAYEECQDIIRKHMNDGWIPVEERMPTQEECEDNWFWIAYGDSFGNSSRVARCEWVFADDENGNDDSGSEFYIDQFPLPYKPSKNLIKAWKIIDIPAPYRSERNGT